MEFLTLSTKSIVMRKLLSCCAILFLFAFASSDAPISKKERKTALSFAKETKQKLLKAVKGLSDEQLKWRLNDSSWSVADCVEHLAISEKFISDRAYNSLKEDANPARRAEMKNKDEDVITWVTNRGNKLKAPEPLRPTGQFGSTEEALKVFVERRDKNMEYLKSTQDDLRNHFVTHSALGTIDAYQMLIYMIGHTERHTAQIEAIISSPGFPKK